jgi:predicted ATP-grasp superfamily ATP-dependent carboligase
MDAAARIVILGSSTSALAVARCAHRLELSPVVFDSAAEVAASSRYVQAEIHPAATQDGTLARLVQLARQQRSLLIATSDTWLRFLMLHRAVLQSCFTRILHPDNVTLATCLDKGRFASWCAQHQLPAPRRFDLPGPVATQAALPFPLLVRPAETLHSIADAGLKAVEVHCSAQLNDALAGLARTQRRAVVCESLLGRPLRQYSVGLARRGEELLTVVARKLRPGPAACSTGTLVETAEDAGVEALARRVAVLLDYQGIAEVEILQDAATGENFLIEVNPRPWLQFALGAATGRDLLGLVARGQPRCPPRVAPGRPARWLDFRGDLRAWIRSHDAATPRRGGPWELVRSAAGAQVFARWSARDQKPFWHDLAEMLRLRPEHPAGTGPRIPHAAGSAAQLPRPP